VKEHLRMKEVVEKTGVNKSTILHYIHLGLLPEPIRTSKNMAYYPDSYLVLLAIIRALQGKYHLPLLVIKSILDCMGPEPSMEKALHKYEVFYKTEFPTPEGGDRTYNRQEFLEATGLTGDALQYLEQNHLLIPIEEDIYNADDFTVAQYYFFAKEHHIPLERMEFLPRLATQLTLEAQKFHSHAVQGRSQKEEWEITHFLSSHLKSYHFYLLRRLFDMTVKTMGKPENETGQNIED